VERSYAASVLLCAVLILPHARDTQAADAARGRVLYTRHCESCHAPGVHGHTPRTPATRDELRAVVDQFRKRRALQWTDADVEDVVEHLDTMSYRFPKSGERRASEPALIK
jgi:mono/diheme cytochrome c family protein